MIKFYKSWVYVTNLIAQVLINTAGIEVDAAMEEAINKLTGARPLSQGTDPR